MKKPIVVKIGGSTFDSGDTVVEDLVALQKQGHRMVVVHGGANEVTGWLKKMNIPTRIVNGLRVTDRDSLRVVVAVLCGAVNKEIVAQIQSLGGRAVGLCGIDGRLFEAKVREPEYGLIGNVEKVNAEPIELLLKSGYMPIVAPTGYGIGDETILNVNGDPAAGALAAALGAKQLIMLTDVPGVMDKDKKVMHHLTRDGVRSLIGSKVAAGGMIPKLEACLRALEKVPVAQIIDGTAPHALLDAVGGKEIGTIIA
jgi:acetylglutamate kinase